MLALQRFLNLIFEENVFSLKIHNYVSTANLTPRNYASIISHMGNAKYD